MPTEENKALIRRAYDALNQRDLAAFYELLTPDFVLHDASMTIQGLEAYQQWVSMYLAAFPDVRLTIEEMTLRETRSPFAKPFVAPTRATSWVFHRQANR